MDPACVESGERGFALVLVLWALLLLGVIGEGLSLEARATKTLAVDDMAHLQAQLVLDGSINRAIAALLDARDPLHLTLDGERRNLRLLDRDVVLSVQSEAGKIDLNAAPPSLLSILFQQGGATAAEAEALAGEVAVWRASVRSPDRQGCIERYRTAGRRYEPRFASFRSVGELGLVLGMSDALLLTVEPLVTVWSGSGAVDRSVASEDMLRVMAATGDALATTQQDARDAGHAAGADRTAAVGEVVTISASLSAGPASRRTAAIQVAADPHEPYRVLAWH